jgi:hypothetical protein
MINGGLTPPPQREAAIPKGFASLEKQIASFLSLLDGLETTMKPVLRIEPLTQLDKPPECPTPLDNTMHAKLADYARRIGKGNDRLQEILRLCEL